MTQDQLVTNKKVKSFKLTDGDIKTLVDPGFKSLMITDIVISTSDDEKIEIFIEDEEHSVPILFTKQNGTHTFNFPTGLLYWKNAKLKCKKFGQRETWITIGYLIFDGDNYEKWSM